MMILFQNMVGYFKKRDNLKILKYIYYIIIYIIIYTRKDLKILLQNFLLFLIIVF